MEIALANVPRLPGRVVVCPDVSGSMQPYSRFLVQFAKGLIRCWDDSDVYLFHTRLVRVSEVLREKDALLAMCVMEGDPVAEDPGD